MTNTMTVENGHELMPPAREQEDPRGDGWFVLRSGGKFFPLLPRPDEIHIEDIAFALSNICRFGGHVEFYSVSEHCCHIHDAAPQHLKMLALLHDATEAYLGDMVRPLKQQMPQYRLVEDQLWNIIAERFSLPSTTHAVKELDNRALLAERNFLMEPGPNTRDWYWDHNGTIPLDCKIGCWSPMLARAQFMKRYNELIKS